ncbi:unnamed protein product [Orchesella dallaii]|uniref:Odorant receptor n=1 Tax=Orchesella dallaii TaxID=48710 RepID=A0ABP1S849_9HEXA
MITARMKKMLYYRILFNKYLTRACILDCDTKLNQFKEPKGYLKFNMFLIAHVILFYTLMMVIWLELKDFDAEDTEIPTDFQFGSYVLGWIWTGCAFMLATVMNRLLEYSSQLAYVMNQIFHYDEKIQENLTSHWKNNNSQYNNPHERMAQAVELMVFGCAILTAALPLALISAMCTDYEPTHILIKEWFEVELSFVPQHFPFLLLMLWGAFVIAEVTFEILVTLLVYVVFVTCYTSSLFPVLAKLVVIPSSRQIIQYRIETRHFGTMQDSQLVEMFRVQQIINILINDIFASLLVSFHHVVCLLVFVGLSFILLEFSHLLAELGIMISVAVVACWFAPLVVIYVESVNGGGIFDTTSAFVKQCKHSTIRRSVLRKYAASWATLVLETAYPFYKVHRNTFLEFVMQGIDFIITLVTTHSAF